jgi:hypothetical protein
VSNRTGVQSPAFAIGFKASRALPPGSSITVLPVPDRWDKSCLPDSRPGSRLRLAEASRLMQTRPDPARWWSAARRDGGPTHSDISAAQAGESLPREAVAGWESEARRATDYYAFCVTTYAIRVSPGKLPAQFRQHLRGMAGRATGERRSAIARVRIVRRAVHFVTRRPVLLGGHWLSIPPDSALTEAPLPALP